MKNQNPNEITNVEFGIEFGDVNGVKLYEFPLKNDKKKNKAKKEK